MRLNSRRFRKLPGSRRMLFATLDRPALRPLPAAPYVFAEWKRARVNIDYHVSLDGHCYSVPYQLVQHEVELRFSATVVEVFHLISIPVTQTSVNPARSTGVAVFVGDWALAQLWLFWLAPILGGMLGAALYRVSSTRTRTPASLMLRPRCYRHGGAESGCHNQSYMHVNIVHTKRTITLYS